MLLKALQAVIPEPLIKPDPVPHRAESFGDNAVAPFAPVALLGQETSIEQDAEVLGDGRAAHFKMRGDVVDRAFGVGEQIQHLPSRTMTDRCEHIGLVIGYHDHAAIYVSDCLPVKANYWLSTKRPT